MASEKQKTPTEPTEEPDGLTGKQTVFVAEYLSNGFNATRAAVEAGYAPGSAHAEGWRLLRHPKIAGAISKAFQDKGIAPETIQILLGIVAFQADIADFDPWIKKEKTLEQLRAEGVDTKVVKAATINAQGGRRIELHDRLAALKELGRILGMVTEKSEVSTTHHGLPPLESLPPKEGLEKARHKLKSAQVELRFQELMNEQAAARISGAGIN